ncbi:MAG: DUF5723 family protein [Parabacteroides sp.]|nr:DUF5723 family protein [Parabacteroides sp.]
MKKYIIITILALYAISGWTQTQFSAYFMKDLSISSQLNPSYNSTYGYLSMPIIGNVGYGMNVAGSSPLKLLKAISGTDLYNDNLYDALSDETKLGLSLRTDILNLGFTKGNGFWTVNAALRGQFNSTIPKSFIDYFRNTMIYDESYGSDYSTDIDIQNFNMNINAYGEIGVGYSHKLNENLSVGGRIKLLLGFIDLNMQIDRMNLKMNLPSDPYDESTWVGNPEYGGYAETDANIRSAYGKGTALDFDESGRLQGLDFGSFGIAGYGVGFDLGVSYSPIERLNLYASALDMGMIKWKESSVSMAETNSSESVNITQDNFEQYLEDDIFNPDMFSMQKKKSEGYKTKLNTTLMIGGEYKLGTYKQFGVGAIYSGLFRNGNMNSVITITGNIMDKKGNNGLSLSFSNIQKHGNSLGATIKFGKSFIYADYTLSGVAANTFSVMVGSYFILGKKTD